MGFEFNNNNNNKTYLSVQLHPPLRARRKGESTTPCNFNTVFSNIENSTLNRS